MRRFALPFALSLAAHAALVALIWLLPARFPSPRAGASVRGMPVELCILGPERPRVAPPRNNDDWPIDFQPKVIPAIGTN